MFKSMKMRTMLLAGFGMVSIILLVVGMAGIIGIGRLGDDVTEIGNVRMPSVLGLGIMNEGQTAVQRAERILLYERNPQIVERQYSHLEDAWRRIEEGWKIYEPLPQSAEEAKVWKEFEPKWEAWEQAHKEVVGLVKAGNFDAAHESSYGKGRGAFEKSEKLLGELIEMNRLIGTESVAEAKAGAASFSSIAVVCMAVGVLLAMGLGILITRRVMGKLGGEPDYVTEIIRKISAGDLSMEIETKGKAEDSLIVGMRKVAETIQGLVGDANLLAKAAVEGKLGTRADATKHQGDFRKIVEGVNDTLDAVIGPLNVAAEYVDRISKGDIPEKIKEEYKGDFNEIKNNLNQCIDAVRLLTGDANLLAKAAVEGKLSTRADATKHQGDFRKIVEGVNDTLDAVIGPLNEEGRVLEAAANKNLTQRMTGDYLGEFAKMKENMNKVVQNLDEALQQVAEGVEQVSAASTQISSGSQSLAQGANEQASFLEEISSSLEEMSSMTKQNAENAGQAKSLAESARGSAERGNNGMKRMSDAIAKIKSSSDETAKIIKTIDEIAFQTNLLALNAAVEAARAGEAGKGFAVVAEEVRNLAQRSAEAAKNTANMIEDSVKKAEDGVKITDEVAKILVEIFEGSGKVHSLIGEIAAASEEQAKGIDQVNTAVAEMNKVTQQNAANSEESASASEELDGQAQELAAMVEKFTLSGNGGSRLGSAGKAVGLYGTHTAKPLHLAPVRQAKGAGDKMGKGFKAKVGALVVKRAQNVIPLDEQEMRDF